VEATIPNVPRSSGLVVNTPGTLVFAGVGTCQRCGQENPTGSRFCNACGAALGERATPVEERRIVSVVFVDLVGFTARSEELDPEDVRAFLLPYYERVRSELESFGGRVEKFIGDAVMGVFGAPVAYGDDHERAVRAALAVQEWAVTDGLEVRVAVNTGEAIVELEARAEQGEALIAGDVVNTAARLQSAAPVGGVLVGHETYAATRSSIEYRPAPPVAAKGKAEPVRVWLALRATAPVGERPQAPVPIVGRERELDLLQRIWDDASTQRRPALVTVFGPSGIGKSRLALELAGHVSSLGGRALRGRSTPYGASTPYSAFGQHVKQVAGVFDNDGLDDARRKLRASVSDLVDGLEEAEAHAEHLAMLVGLGGSGEAADRETLFFSARVLVEALAERGPTMLLFEDIHWADASLLDLVEMLAARVRDVPLLLLALSRPELLTDRPTWGGGLPAYTALPLDRLSDDDAQELAGRLLDRAGTSPEQADAVARTGEGNPLFIEELAASLSERSTLDAGLPTSVRAIVAARLDALPAAERAVLVDAAVVGRVFWRGALARISPDVDVGSALGTLEERDFVRREAVSRITGEQQFAFKHAVIREVAYERLPRAARRERHAAVAAFLEERTGDVGQANEAIAEHWREAGEDRRALDCLVAAAEQAGRGWAKEHAVALYKAALGLAGPDDEGLRRELRRRLAVAEVSRYHVTDVRAMRDTTRDETTG
jgi:class 3 adenylate cyclase